MKSFSDNIIFFDTEFTSLDPKVCELLSIALIKPSGEEFYIEVEYTGTPNSWVRENILPTLTQPKVSVEEAKKKITEFAGPTRPFLVSFVPHFDMMLMYKLYGANESELLHPFHKWPIDFASILFSRGINPEHYFSNAEEISKQYGIDISKYHQHHALDDARLLREVFLKFFQK